MLGLDRLRLSLGVLIEVVVIIMIMIMIIMAIIVIMGGRDGQNIRSELQQLNRSSVSRYVASL